MSNDILRMFIAVLSVLKLVLGSFGINFPNQWFNMVVNIVAGLFAVYAFVKHNFIGKKGKKQKEHLRENGLL